MHDEVSRLKSFGKLMSQEFDTFDKTVYEAWCGRGYGDCIYAFDSVSQGFSKLADQVIFNHSPPVPAVSDAQSLNINGEIHRSKKLLEPIIAILITSYFNFLCLYGAEA